MKKKIIILLVISILLVGCSKSIDKKSKNIDKSLADIKENLFYAESNNYVNELSEVIDKIKEIEPEFDINDYKLTFRIVNSESNSGLINLNYYINNKIRTNKIYTVDFENYKLNELKLIGIDEENIKNVDTIDLDSINKKITEFEENKADIIFKEIPEFYIEKPTLNSDKTLTKNNLHEKVKNFSEYYYYDYNLNKLSYKVEITKVNPQILEVEYIEEKEIEL